MSISQFHAISVNIFRFSRVEILPGGTKLTDELFPVFWREVPSESASSYRPKQEYSVWYTLTILLSLIILLFRFIYCVFAGMFIL